MASDRVSAGYNNASERRIRKTPEMQILSNVSRKKISILLFAVIHKLPGKKPI
jgi:hypothetical protein